MTAISNDSNVSNPDHTLWKLIHGIRFAMLTTMSDTGDLRSRPLTTQNEREDHRPILWFFVPLNGEVVADIQRQPQVNVVYADPDGDRYVSVSGTGRVVNDLPKKKELWSTFSQAWFPQGVDDPNLALLAIDATRAEYWNVTDSKMVQLFKMAKAAATGETPRLTGEHREVPLS